MKRRLQGIVVFLLIGILALCATGCSMLSGTGTGATATPEPDATTPPQQIADANYVVYDEEADFSISYHENWKIKENKSDDGTVNFDYANVTFTIPEGLKQEEAKEAGTVYPTLTVYQFPIEDTTTFHLEEYVDAQVKNLETEVYQFYLNEKKPCEINGVAAYQFTYSGSVLNANNLLVKQVILADEANVYIMTYGATGEMYDTYLAVADKIISSFILK